MEIEIKRLLEGAKEAKGLAVVIDVIRANTTIAILISNGVKKIIAVAELEEALILKKRNPDFIAIGERKCLKPEGFDYGNSPAEIENIDLKDKKII